MTDERPAPYPADFESLREDSPQGEPPRPATEPPGAQGSSNSGKTATNPATGETNQDVGSPAEPAPPTSD